MLGSRLWVGAVHQAPAKNQEVIEAGVAERRVSRIPAFLILALGICSAVFAALAWVASRKEGLVVEDPVVFATARAGDEVLVRFQLRNRTLRTIRLIGATETCGAGGCNTVEGLPAEIPPCSTYELSVKLLVRKQPGEFSKEFTLYTDCPGQPNLLLTIKSRVEAKDP